ncbi:hypothetical protein [Halomarina oriensis]|uniref:Uncharacterized protein n=1 Tax=Halomarina oriensis TaxID=671145 RepID=A0A6B0GQ24_9EURY|nr:hypothetical protein [Halomarina oriensis]MWG36952.1 hypothetical protein [Halomarina oriensis]
MGRPQFSALTDTLSQTAEREDATETGFGTYQGIADGDAVAYVAVDNAEGDEPLYIVSADVAISGGTYTQACVASLTVEEAGNEPNKTFISTRNPPTTNWDMSTDLKVPSGYVGVLRVYNDSGGPIDADVNVTWRTDP